MLIGYRLKIAPIATIDPVNLHIDVSGELWSIF